MNLLCMVFAIYFNKTLYSKRFYQAILRIKLTAVRNNVKKFWDLWNEDKLKHLSIVLELEKFAMRKGYSLATGLVAGYCQFCEKCTLDRVTCPHPTRSRISEEAVGVNVEATAKNAGMVFTFPFKTNPESFALLLII